MSARHNEAELLLRKAAEDEVILDKLFADSDVSDSSWAFHAQQALEKILKSALMKKGIRYPKTHDLGVLYQLAWGAGLSPSFSEGDLAELTPFAVTMRYDDSEEVSVDRGWMRKLVAVARAWAEGL